MIEKKDIDKVLNFKSVVRPKALVVTVMCDVAAVHGKRVWSGDLVRICQWFGITEHSSRISFQRLIREGWIQKWKDNFYIYFELTKAAVDTFEFNQSTIYQRLNDKWDGKWHLLILNKNSKNVEHFINNLTLMGYKKLYKNAYLFPSSHLEYVEKKVRKYNLTDKVIFLLADMNDFNQSKVVNQMVNDLWNIPTMTAEMKTFMDQLNGLNSKILNQIIANPKMSLYTRLKLIQEYRRLALKYFHIPQKVHNQQALLNDIYKKLSKIYHQLGESSIKHITKKMRYMNGGNLPNLDRSFKQRFSLTSAPVDPIKQVTFLTSENLKSFIK